MPRTIWSRHWMFSRTENLRPAKDQAKNAFKLAVKSFAIIEHTWKTFNGSFGCHMKQLSMSHKM